MTCTREAKIAKIQDKKQSQMHRFGVQMTVNTDTKKHSYDSTSTMQHTTTNLSSCHSCLQDTSTILIRYCSPCSGPPSTPRVHRQHSATCSLLHPCGVLRICSKYVIRSCLALPVESPSHDTNTFTNYIHNPIP